MGRKSSMKGIHVMNIFLDIAYIYSLCCIGYNLFSECSIVESVDYMVKKV